MNKQLVRDLYEGKILGVRNYKSDKTIFIPSDLIDFKVLFDFLLEVRSGESDISPAGIVFIEDYFGVEDLAQRLHEADFSKDYLADKTPQEISAWLKQIVPIEISSFIAESEGLNLNDITLKEEYLPPSK